MDREYYRANTKKKTDGVILGGVVIIEVKEK